LAESGRALFEGLRAWEMHIGPYQPSADTQVVSSFPRSGTGTRSRTARAVQAGRVGMRAGHFRACGLLSLRPDGFSSRACTSEKRADANVCGSRVIWMKSRQVCATAGAHHAPTWPWVPGPGRAAPYKLAYSSRHAERPGEFSREHSAGDCRDERPWAGLSACGTLGCTSLPLAPADWIGELGHSVGAGSSRPPSGLPPPAWRE
jgi:hypothetical protein